MASGSWNPALTSSLVQRSGETHGWLMRPSSAPSHQPERKPYMSTLIRSNFNDQWPGEVEDGMGPNEVMTYVELSQ